ncbi:polymorphic toxin type 15 domain-containing protein [Actinomyces howellii]|uniref:polymorphic toxin type 15 domain-containing protein n=1 Tax=Actinomyces howellii TaxID=52771 RepID=UPI0013DEC25C|nr:polymorphic toxin type 15 domain-containing protein [Actinomyces howellii]
MFFHTGGNPGLRALSGEFTRQLDRQLSALSLLSAQRLLEGIRAYRAQGRAPASKTVKRARQDFIDKVSGDLRGKHGFSRSRAREAVGLVDKALVVLHESDQVTYGPGDPVLIGGLPSMGVDRVNSSIGSQNKSVADVLEQAVLAVPVERRAGCRLRLRAVLTASRSLARNLRHARVVLEARSAEQVTALSARAPPWTPATIAADVAAAHHQAAIPASTPATDPGPGAPPGAGRITPRELLEAITGRAKPHAGPGPQTPPPPAPAPTIPTRTTVPSGTTVSTVASGAGGPGPVRAATFPAPASAPVQAPAHGTGAASARTPRQVKTAITARAAAAGQDRAPAPPAHRKSPGLDR